MFVMLLFLFLSAKVRRFLRLRNPTRGLFRIPQSWYSTPFEPYTLFYIICKIEKKNKKFGGFKENTYFCQQKTKTERL